MLLKTLVKTFISLFVFSSYAQESIRNTQVGITPGVIEIAGISRNQDTNNTIHPAFAKTSRPCPPFCIQPTNPFYPAQVEMVTELDVIDTIKTIKSGDNSLLLVDARTSGWVEKGTIPGAINIPFTHFKKDKLAHDPMFVIQLLVEHFGVLHSHELLDFSQAKTLVLFCNGSWCEQSPLAIKALLKLGYPAAKLKYYRGGINNWHSLSLTITE